MVRTLNLSYESILNHSPAVLTWEVFPISDFPWLKVGDCGSYLRTLLWKSGELSTGPSSTFASFYSFPGLMNSAFLASFSSWAFLSHCSPRKTTLLYCFILQKDWIYLLRGSQLRLDVCPGWVVPVHHRSTGQGSDLPVTFKLWELGANLLASLVTQTFPNL